jgi:hypothetical protein
MQDMLICIFFQPKWKRTKTGKITAKSMYNHLSSNGADRSFKHLWRAEIPLKIKIWLWLILHNAIASKDNTPSVPKCKKYKD